jgi:hypothetical protein
LAYLLADLPPQRRGVGRGAKERLLATFNTLVNYSIPVVDEAELEEEGEAQEVRRRTKADEALTEAYTKAGTSLTNLERVP